jgi:hypothetical protein
MKYDELQPGDLILNESQTGARIITSVMIGRDIITSVMIGRDLVNFTFIVCWDTNDTFKHMCGKSFDYVDMQISSYCHVYRAGKRIA